MSLLVVPFDRFLMGFSLAVHIILASVGIALPAVMLISEFLGIKFKNPYYETMARRLSLAFVVLFAIGTASGLLVALNIFLLWPKFMALVSQVAILPFFIEVFAFFMESIFLGAYIYSWDKFENRYAHVIVGIPIAVGGALSGILITMINAFMNTPAGFNIPAYLQTGVLTGIMPLAVFNTPSTWIEIPHVMSTIYFAGGFIILSYGALMLLRTRREQGLRRDYYVAWLKLLLLFVAVGTVLSLFTGINTIAALIHIQPEKFAAIEGDILPQAFAPERIGGILVNGTLRDYIPIPNLQSVLATGSAAGNVPGLSSYPTWTWPPLIIHDMFDFMVIFGAGIGAFIALLLVLWIARRNIFANRKVLYLLVVAGIFGMIILELGWVVAELGRQPWIIYNVMLVSQAANTSQSIIPIAAAILAFYIAAIPATVLILRAMFRRRPIEKELIKRTGYT